LIAHLLTSANELQVYTMFTPPSQVTLTN